MGRTGSDVTASILNNSGSIISPATEAKQDTIISAVEIPKDMEGLGWITVGTTAVELVFTGTTKAISFNGHIDNLGTIYGGKSDVQSDGTNAVVTFQAGQPVSMNYDDVDNAAYLVASIADQKALVGALL